MKKILLILGAITTILSSCVRYPVAQQTGKEDTAFLLFVTNNKNTAEYVQVKLDDLTFDANVVSKKKSYRKGTQYSVKPGKRHIIVTSNNEIIYQKDIFLSPQEVKQIILP